MVLSLLLPSMILEASWNLGTFRKKSISDKLNQSGIIYTLDVKISGILFFRFLVLWGLKRMMDTRSVLVHLSQRIVLHDGYYRSDPGHRVV